ncbi:MAG: tRNA (adenosine(37)-N6)-threonylcarbamoyltransferase complex dimerization subunit type 1 TsaB, partial [Bryobacteraceae bacterium]
MTPRVLAIDTTSETGSLALLEGDTVIGEEAVDAPDGFAHVLFDRIGALLESRGWRVSEIDCFAAAAGPGSYTGVRVGLTAVKGLAETTGMRVAAVSTLAALAWYGAAPLRAPVLDSGRGDVFGALYDDAGALVAGEVAAAPRDWISALDPGVEFVTVAPEWWRSLAG